MEFSGTTPDDVIDVLIRLGGAILAGLIIGLDREIKHKTAGIRTYTVVALGAAGYTIAIIEMSFRTMGNDVVGTDPTRIFQGLVGALGFLGAGAVINAGEGGPAKGLVTAALIWVAGAVGIAAGMGLLALALAIALGATLTVAALEFAELKLGERESLNGPGRGEENE
ncbi:MgtC/SapB family protein [Parvularcula oceani]|uniref:MgtC/SapB family protein n=1 Tax=Parvularcula oceani TaxID=1247963 RepID=UPI00068F2529|nr:MgtC/SapB family protein [Parvularcula oceani]